MTMRSPGRRATKIYSIFGDCEAAAAEVLIAEGVATRLLPRLIPEAMMTNRLGQQARFAVVIPGNLIPRFEEMIKDLRA